MKNVFKIALSVAIVALASVTSAAAQKVGRINSQVLIAAMPETTAMQKDLEKVRDEYAENLETMQAELQNKYADYQKNAATMTESVRSLKEKDMQDLDQRMQQFEQNAMQEIQRKQASLAEPIIAKAREAIAATAKAGGYTVIYDESAGALAYYDEATVKDILPAVKVKLGIK
ncbi:MAG: OmpH family outer membrane protein [Rikenellaceae bacterium]